MLISENTLKTKIIWQAKTYIYYSVMSRFEIYMMWDNFLPEIYKNSVYSTHIITQYVNVIYCSESVNVGDFLPNQSFIFNT